MKEWPYYVNKTRICTLARKPRTHVPIFFFWRKQIYIPSDGDEEFSLFSC